MPHVEIKCFPGRTEEQKKECADRITRAIVETLGCKEESVSVAIKDIPEADWKDKVWDPQIVSDEKYLYKKPEYTC